MRTIFRGISGEAAVLRAFADVEIPTFVPFGGGSPVDLLAWLSDDSIVRVQVKCGRVRKGCIEFNSSSTDHGHGQRSYRGRADVFAVHVRELDQVFVIAVDEIPEYRGYLRLDPPSNNQRLGVRFAEDHTFERWAARVLGERVVAA